MLMPKKNRVAIYSQLFKDGVAVVKKDPMMKKHGEIDVPNLHVMNVMKSLKSREYVRETFSWQYYYYYLTDEGIEYLRGFLNLPSTIKVRRPQPPRRERRRRRATEPDVPPRDRARPARSAIAPPPAASRFLAACDAWRLSPDPRGALASALIVPPAAASNL